MCAMSSSIFFFLLSYFVVFNLIFFVSSCFFFVSSSCSSDRLADRPYMIKFQGSNQFSGSLSPGVSQFSRQQCLFRATKPDLVGFQK